MKIVEDDVAEESIARDANPYRGPEKVLRQQSGKGKRVVIVHAITKHGLLKVDGVDGPTVADLPSGVEYETAEWIFPASSHGDYHKQMNNQRFMSWVK